MTHTHFIGIGGTGLSAIARVLLERGQTVSGSDRSLSPLAESVQKAGATVYTGHAAENIKGADVVVRSSAVPDDNVEVVAAEEAGLKVLKRVDYLGQLLVDCRVIGIAGSHGKTTTTSMTAWMLYALNKRPGFIVGGIVENLGVNASAGSSPYFVIEADEYDYMFWGLTSQIAVVTNVEHDHPDCFPTPESFTKAFEGYVDRIAPDGVLIACIDDVGSAELLAYAKEQGKSTFSYSLDDLSADYSARDLDAQVGSGYHFTAYRGEEVLAKVELQVPGRHNVMNALAALAVADQLEFDVKNAALALADFRGAGRRFEVLGEPGGVLVIDDYGHHPTEIKATLSAARDRYPGRRIWAVWQPHTFSRTTQLMEEFGQAFELADQVIVTNVYAARETQPEDFTYDGLVAAIKNPQVLYKPELDETAAALLEAVRPGDVVIVLSAGDAILVSSQLMKKLNEEEQHA